MPIIHGLAPEIVEGRIDLFHYTMFHGALGIRERSRDTGNISRDITDVPDPLRFIVNRAVIGRVIAPEFVLVVTKAVRDSLAGIPHLLYWRAFFDRVVDFPTVPGDFSYWKLLPGGDDPDDELESFFESLPHVGESGLEDYYEVVVPQYYRHRHEFDLSNATMLPSPLWTSPDVPVTAMFFDKYPIILIGATYFMATEVFQRIAPYIDWDYFATAQFEVQ